MYDHGPSTKPVERGFSDAVDIYYPDPHDLKSERSAHASIFSTRAYIWAKKNLLGQATYLSEPPSRNIKDSDGLEEKFLRIGTAFVDAMSKGVKRDERRVLQLSDEDPVKRSYRRYEEMLQPIKEMAPPGDILETTMFGGTRVVNRDNMVYNAIFGAAEVLPTNISLLIKYAYADYFDRFGTQPSVETALKIMSNSYESYIKVNTHRHRVGLRKLITIQKELFEKNRYSDITELRGDSEDTFHIAFRPEIEERVSIREEIAEGILSRQVTCAFDMPTQYTKDYLGIEPDFEDPLKDAFHLQMGLLAA